jgi:CheY-like chemotaxis protein
MAVRLVVADDHPGILNAITALLRDRYELVAVVSNGLDAVRATADLSPDVVVLDIAMPGADGFQAATQIRASGSAPRIVFLSNHTGDDFVLAGMAKGASAFVAKFRLQLDLIDAIEHALNNRAFVPSADVLPLWRPRPRTDHDLQLYSDDAFLADAALRYFDRALESGDSIIAITSQAHRVALEARSHRFGLDLTGLSRSGQYQHLDAASAFDLLTNNGAFDSDTFAALLNPYVERAVDAAAASARHVTIFGEIAPIACARGDLGTTLLIERLAEDYAASHQCSLLCAYSTAALGDRAVHASVCRQHATIVPDGLVR